MALRFGARAKLVPKQFIGLGEGGLVTGENRSLWQCQLTDAPSQSLKRNSKFQETNSLGTVDKK